MGCDSDSCPRLNLCDCHVNLNSKRFPLDSTSILIIMHSCKDAYEMVRDGAARALAWAVRDNFVRLPERVRNELLVRLSEKTEAAQTVAMIMARNFDKIP